MKKGMVRALTVCAIGAAAAAQAAETTSFEYDPQGRLTQSTRSDGPAAGTTKTTSYDRAGNRTNQTVTGAGSAMMAGGAMGEFSTLAVDAGGQDGLVDDTALLPDPPVSEGAPYVGESPPTDEPIPDESSVETGE